MLSIHLGVLVTLMNRTKIPDCPGGRTYILLGEGRE